jgi:hypothetical protein
VTDRKKAQVLAFSAIKNQQKAREHVGQVKTLQIQGKESTQKKESLRSLQALFTNF